MEWEVVFTIGVNVSTFAILYYKIGKLEASINGFIKPKVNELNGRVVEVEKKVAALEARES